MKILEKTLTFFNKKTVADLCFKVAEGVISRQEVLKAIYPDFKEETKDTYFLLEEGIYTHALTKLRPRTIESLVGMDNLTLTPNAIKQLGL